MDEKVRHNPEHYWPTEEEMERLLAEEADRRAWSDIKAIVAASEQGAPELVAVCERYEREPAVCPNCGEGSGFSGRVVWCPCSGWVK